MLMPAIGQADKVRLPPSKSDEDNAESEQGHTVSLAKTSSAFSSIAWENRI
jgi:hypothetical protein